MLRGHSRGVNQIWICLVLRQKMYIFNANVGKNVPLIKYGATSSEETFGISNSKKKRCCLVLQITSSHVKMAW